MLFEPGPRGTTWSRVSCMTGSATPQARHRKPKRCFRRFHCKRLCVPGAPRFLARRRWCSTMRVPGLRFCDARRRMRWQGRQQQSRPLGADRRRVNSVNGRTLSQLLQRRWPSGIGATVIMNPRRPEQDAAWGGGPGRGCTSCSGKLLGARGAANVSSRVPTVPQLTSRVNRVWVFIYGNFLTARTPGSSRQGKCRP